MGSESASDRPTLDIALGVIGPIDGPWLLEVRPADTHLAGLLAFPGGKCATNETPESALARELREEIGIEPRQTEPLIVIPWDYPERRVRLHVLRVPQWWGKPQGREGQQVRWCGLSELWATPFPPANRGILAALSLPPVLAISAACRPGDAAFERWLDDLAMTSSALTGRALVQLRPGRALTEAQWLAAMARVRAAGQQVLINASGPLPAVAAQADGVHLSSATLMALTDLDRMRSRFRWITAAVHRPDQLAQANRLAVDAVLVSPVQPTASHPKAGALGWAEFAARTEQAQMPVYALGGMTRQDLPRVVTHGGQGVAAIAAFWRGEIAR